MSKANNLGDFLESVANAIRAKKGTTALINPQDFDAEIENLPNKLTDLANGTLASITEEDLKGLSFIAEYSFYHCTSITSLTIPNSVEEVKTYAFYLCNGLQSLTLGTGLKTVRAYAFSSLSGLTGVYYKGTMDSWCDIYFDGSASGTNPIYYAKNLYINNNLVTDLVVSNSVSEIKANTFYNATCLKTIKIGTGVASIKNNAFNGCNQLTSITIYATTPPSLASTNALSSTNNCPIYVPAGSVSSYKSATNWTSYSSRIQAIP